MVLEEVAGEVLDLSLRFFGLTVIISIGQWPPRSLFDVIWGVAIGILFVVGLMAFPQIMFKPKERMLSLNETGIYTEIGKIKRQIGWAEISKVEETPHAIVITRKKSGNAFIVPERAFPSRQEREAFYKAAKDWQSQARSHS